VDSSLNNIPKLKQLSTNQKVSKQTVKKILLEAHRHQWALDRKKCSDGKLRTYVKFKAVYGRENYLSFINHKNIFSILKFRKLIHVIPTILKRSCLVLSYFEQDIKKCISSSISSELHCWHILDSGGVPLYIDKIW
jgi:hypothetical protein